MKKTLLLVTILCGCFYVNAQTLQNENFNELNVGNVGTDITGVTTGQGDLLTYTSAGANSDFQIISEGGDYANVLQITGSANATATKFLWKGGLAAGWATRTSGNDIIEIEYDFYTGATTASKSTTGIRLFNSAGQTVAGFRFVPETKAITGLARYDNAGTVNTFFFNLGASNAVITLAENTWYRIGVAFNQITGEVIWKGPGFNSSIVGTEIGVDPDEADFVVAAGTDNTVSTVAKFDNLTIKATATENLLSVQEVDAPLVESIKLYPNPVKDVLFISASNVSITNVEIIDINGRLVKSVSSNNSFDSKITVSDLSAGVYMINIYSENNKTTKKFVKN